MTIYHKNGSLAVTIVRRLTTQTMQTTNGTTSSNGVSNAPSVLIDDEDEFIERDEWKNAHKMASIVYDVNVAMAVIFSVVELFLLLTVLDRKLREKSQMWYIYHLCFLTVLIGLIFHTLSHSGVIFQDMQTCYFVMYGTEYSFFGVAMNIFLINMEIYFTKIFTLQKWESNPFFRFLVLILSGWLVVCLIVTHVVINNNRPVSNRFCLYIKEKSVRDTRYVLRAFLPAVVCFIFIIVSVVTYFLKRSRIRFTTMSGELKEIRTEGRDDEKQWLKCVMFLDIVFVIREASTMMLFFNSKIYSPDHFKTLIIILLIHVQAMYMLPMCMFFLADVRTTLKTFTRTALVKVSFGRVRIGDDLENLSVSFANTSQADNS